MDLISVVDSFDLVAIVPETLVLCDIDNTLLYVEEDENSHGLYTQLYSHYFHITQNSGSAMKLADNDYYARYPMRPTDPAGFERMLAKIRKTHGCELIFLTARNPDTVDFTADNFVQIGLNPEEHMVHFSDFMPKGQYTKTEIDLSPYKNIVFIDDVRENLTNMKMHVRNLTLDLYLFRIRK